jgi:hypothetical protein
MKMIEKEIKHELSPLNYIKQKSIKKIDFDLATLQKSYNNNNNLNMINEDNFGNFNNLNSESVCSIDSLTSTTSTNQNFREFLNTVKNDKIIQNNNKTILENEPAVVINNNNNNNSNNNNNNNNNKNINMTDIEIENEKINQNAILKHHQTSNNISTLAHNIDNIVIGEHLKIIIHKVMNQKLLLVCFLSQTKCYVICELLHLLMFPMQPKQPKLSNYYKKHFNIHFSWPDI